MSRILRRPMFRGGPVNSRGTGITTGLTDKPKRGLVDEPGGYSGDIDLFSVVPKTQKYLDLQEKYKSYKPKTLAEVRAEYENALQQKEDNLLFSIGVDEQTPGSYGDKVATDLDYFRTPDGGEAKFFQDAAKEEEKRRIEAETVGITLPNLINAQVEKPNPNRNQVRVAKELDEKDILEADQKKFAEMLGKKKARIQDASNMALGFAGRAFEDEATTKSALGKFFADEAKRPSEAAKIDTAAGSAAINKYIKGEISKQELNTLMKKLEMQNSMQKENKKQTVGQYFLLSKAPGFTGKVKEAVIAAYSQEGVTPEFQVTTSVKMKDEFDFNKDAVGVIFIEEDTNRAYTFDSQGNEITVLNA